MEQICSLLRWSDGSDGYAEAHWTVVSSYLHMKKFTTAMF